jgi:hypothetical protein
MSWAGFALEVGDQAQAEGFAVFRVKVGSIERFPVVRADLSAGRPRISMKRGAK